MAWGYCKLSQQAWASHQDMASMICLNVLSLWILLHAPSFSPAPISLATRIPHTNKAWAYSFLSLECTFDWGKNQPSLEGRSGAGCGHGSLKSLLGPQMWCQPGLYSKTVLTNKLKSGFSVFPWCVYIYHDKLCSHLAVTAACSGPRSTGYPAYSTIFPGSSTRPESSLWFLWSGSHFAAQGDLELHE